MVKTKFEREINAPRKLVFDLLRDRQVEINCKLPQMAGCRIVDDCFESDCRQRVVSEVTAEAPIPALLKPILSKRQLIWHSIQTWDTTHWTCDYETEALFFKDNVDISGRWFFNEKTPGRTTVLIEGVIRINANGIPGLPSQLAMPVSALVEQILLRMTKPNFEKVFSIVESMCREETRAARRKVKS
ncbi:MAG: hypothetical protein WCX65_00485 [bacterium]